eukprot:jgi/Ulvmu1/6041/UM027_0018.1
MELKPAGRATSAPTQDEESMWNTSSSSTAAYPSTPSLQSLREVSSMPALLELRTAARKEGVETTQSTLLRTIYESISKSIDLQRKSTRAVIVLGAVALAVAACVRQFLASLASPGCDADLVAFMRALDLQHHAAALCSQGYTRLADVLHMTHDMLNEEVDSMLPAERHRILYTSAEMLSDSRFTRQAFATARANAKHAWGPLAVLTVALPLAGTFGVFVMIAAALSTPEFRKRLFVLFAVGTTEFWYWLSQRHQKAAGEKKGMTTPTGNTEAAFEPTHGRAAESDAAGDHVGPMYAASSSSRGSSHERRRPGRSSRRNGSGAEAPRTPDAQDAARPSVPVTVASSGGHITSSGRAARRAGSAAAAAFAALTPRSRQRPEAPAADLPHGPMLTAQARGGSDRSIPPVTRIAMPAHGTVRSHEDRRSGAEAQRGPVDMAGSAIPTISSAGLPSMVRSDDAGQAEPLHRLQSRAAFPREPEGMSGPVAEATAGRALNSGLARQPRHVFGGGAATRIGPAAVGGNSSSGSIESSSAMSGMPAVDAAPPPPPEETPPAPTSEGHRPGEIDIALSVVSVDSVKTDGGSPDGQTVSLRTWRNGAALAAHAGAGSGESAFGESAFSDGSAALRANSDTMSTLTDSIGHPEGRKWRSAVRRLQRGNSRMLRLLRSRGDDQR